MISHVLFQLTIIVGSIAYLVLGQQTFTPVVGADTICKPRRNIEILKSQYPAQFNIFILALQRFQQTAESNDLSWFQISGIHGAPTIPWQQPTSGVYNWDLGYCTHRSALFVTWHRPYLLLFEQILSQLAIFVANQFTGAARTTYAAAALELRLPYWDWANQTNLPSAATQQTVTVTIPDSAGNPISAIINNPLYQYNFQTPSFLTTYFTGIFRTWLQTKRRPNAAGIPNLAAVDSLLQGPAGSTFFSRRASVYAALGQNTFGPFNDEIEGIHNDIHVIVGGNGHFSTILYSAFDPIFYLHHANVDRLAAMYQAAKPGQYIVPTTASETFARIVTPLDNQDTLFTPLYPFRHPSGSWWVSDDIKTAPSIWAYGYGYDEVPCEYSTKTERELQLFTVQRINQLYGPGPGLGVTPGFREVSGVSIRSEYAIRIAIDLAELPGSWTFHVFFGRPNEKPENWGLSENHIGSISAFGNPDNTGRKNSKILERDLPISESLVERRIQYVDKIIVEYLKQNLYWGIELGGEEISASKLETLRVGCYSSVVQYPLDDKAALPRWGPLKYLPVITRGKPGGIESENDILGDV